MPVFSTDEFALFDASDVSKFLRFDISAAASATITRVRVPYINGGFYDLPLLQSDQTWAGFNVYTGGSGGLAFGPSAILNYVLDGSNATGLTQGIVVPAMGSQGWMPVVVGKADLTGQTGDIAATTLLASAPVGAYRMDVTVIVTSAGGAQFSVEPVVASDDLNPGGNFYLPFWDIVLLASNDGPLPTGNQMQYSGATTLHNTTVQDIKFHVSTTAAVFTTITYDIHIRLVSLS